MFYTIINTVNAFKFDKENYEELIHSIKESGCYLGYIEDNISHSNSHFDNYLHEKHDFYTVMDMEEKQEQYGDSDRKYSSEGVSIDDSKLQELKETFSKGEDYEAPVELIIEAADTSGYAFTTRVYLKEQESADIGLGTIDNEYEKVNRLYYDEDFILNDSKRFALLPFLMKINDKYMTTHVFINVYKSGFLTVNIYFELPQEYFEQKDERHTPNSFQFQSVELYSNKKTYQKEDYWDKILLKNEHANINEVIKHYICMLEKVSNLSFGSLSSQPLMFYNHGKSNIDLDSPRIHLKNKSDDFNKKETPDKKYLDNHKRFFLSELLNSLDSYTNDLLNENVDEYLQYYLVRKTKKLTYWQSQSAAVLLFNSPLFESSIINTFINDNKIEKLDNAYHKEAFNDFFEYHFKDQIYLAATGMAKLFELAFLQRCMIQRLLKEAKDKKDTSPEEYEYLIEQFNSLQLMQNSELVFNNEGSPKEDYFKIIERMRVPDLVQTTAKLIDNLHKEQLNARERQEKERRKQEENRRKESKKAENRIITLTTILTIILSFSGINAIVNAFGSYINCINTNSTWITIVAWVIVFVIFFIVNKPKKSD